MRRVHKGLEGGGMTPQDLKQEVTSVCEDEYQYLESGIMRYSLSTDSGGHALALAPRVQPKMIGFRKCFVWR